jgi:hypothetical protein
MYIVAVTAHHRVQFTVSPETAANVAAALVRC